ncbi:hypothetical protein WAF17_02790 [Bernardetia sp. ABR2-2B]|uniref:hypothetical protein n=1 Tax=Bernardetia sp. ABR2-2B TaxID=3127472 RepID=UPI0030D1533D
MNFLAQIASSHISKIIFRKVPTKFKKFVTFIMEFLFATLFIFLDKNPNDEEQMEQLVEEKSSELSVFAVDEQAHILRKRVQRGEISQDDADDTIMAGQAYKLMLLNLNTKGNLDIVLTEEDEKKSPELVKSMTESLHLTALNHVS